MCGISGVLLRTPSDKEKIKNGLRKMSGLHTRRGPDDYGFEDLGPVMFGHRRLSIIDLSKAGHQPMEYNGTWITYNGEIYNFLELKKELVAKGYKFKTKTDAEVILALYKEYGAESFSQLRGMFAFGLWDSHAQKLFLVRDRFGIKPLYYYTDLGKLVFASTVRALKESGLVPVEQNSDAFIGFLLFGSVPLPMTTLKNVKAIPAGHYLTISNNGKQELVRYYDQLAAFQEKQDIGFDDAVAEVRKCLYESVRYRLISDAPLGVFLSGGLDSSAISAISAEAMSNQRLKTLSIDFEEQEFSERRYQDMVAKKIGSDHRRVMVRKQDFFDSLPDIFDAMDQPTVDGVNTYFIAKVAKEVGLKTVLSGLGGDEIFLGYQSFRRAEILRRLQKFPTILKSPLYLTQLLGTRYGKFEYLTKNDPMHFYLGVRGMFTPNQIAGILDVGVHEVQSFISKLSELEAYKFTNTQTLSPANLLSYMELTYYLKNQLLKDTDFMSMHHLVEVRVPFLDYKLVEYVASLPPALKLNQRLNKPLLVEVVRDILPTEIFNRPKMGFTFPFAEWLRSAPDDVVGSNNQALFQKFKSGKLHWSRFWASVVLSRFVRLKKGSFPVSEETSKKILSLPSTIKILFLTSRLNKIGGIQQYNRNILDTLRVLERDVDVVELQSLNFFHKIAFVFRLILEVVRRKPDVIFCTHINFSFLCFILKKLSGFDYIVFTHGIEVWNIRNILKKKALKGSKFVVTISRYTAGRIIEQIPELRKNIFFLPNTVDDSRFSISEKPESLMRKHNLISSDKVILTVARLDSTEKLKGYDKVIESLPYVLEEIPSAMYVMVGFGDDLKRIKNLVSDRGIEKRVLLIGSVSDDELPQYYNLCDIFVMPSKKEGFGIVFLEALACGKPVIAGNKDGSRDALLDGELGILVDPDSVEEIKKAIISVLKREIPNNLLNETILREKVLEVYGFDKFQKKVQNLLSELS